MDICNSSIKMWFVHVEAFNILVERKCRLILWMQSKRWTNTKKKEIKCENHIITINYDSISVNGIIESEQKSIQL